MERIVDDGDNQNLLLVNFINRSHSPSGDSIEENRRRSMSGCIPCFCVRTRLVYGQISAPRCCSCLPINSLTRVSGTGQAGFTLAPYSTGCGLCRPDIIPNIVADRPQTGHEHPYTASSGAVWSLRPIRALQY
jgi:hypothetical protein